MADPANGFVGMLDPGSGDFIGTTGQSAPPPGSTQYGPNIAIGPDGSIWMRDPITGTWGQVIGSTSTSGPGFVVVGSGTPAATPGCGGIGLASGQRAPLGCYVATIGADAQPGDNCIPVPQLAINAPAPGLPQRPVGGNVVLNPGGTLPPTNNSATVTNQATVTVNYPAFGGIMTGTIGWVATTRGDGYIFIPNVNLAIGGPNATAGTIVPNTYTFPGPNVNTPADIAAMNAAFNSIASQYHVTFPSWLTAALSAQLPQFNFTPCFRKKLYA